MLPLQVSRILPEWGPHFTRGGGILPLPFCRLIAPYIAQNTVTNHNNIHTVCTATIKSRLYDNRQMLAINIRYVVPDRPPYRSSPMNHSEARSLIVVPVIFVTVEHPSLGVNPFRVPLTHSSSPSTVTAERIPNLNPRSFPARPMRLTPIPTTCLSATTFTDSVR